MSEPSRSELIAWADEAQAYIDAGDVRPSELRKGKCNCCSLTRRPAIAWCKDVDAARLIVRALKGTPA